MKYIEMTGSPKKSTNENGAFYSKKAQFMSDLEDFGFEQAKMKKTNNTVDILVTDSLDSSSKKMELANELGVEIMTYGDIMDMFDLEGDN